VVLHYLHPTIVPPLTPRPRTLTPQTASRQYDRNGGRNPATAKRPWYRRRATVIGAGLFLAACVFIVIGLGLQLWVNDVSSYGGGACDQGV
jgi:hypothetical protein